LPTAELSHIENHSHLTLIQQTKHDPCARLVTIHAHLQPVVMTPEEETGACGRLIESQVQSLAAARSEAIGEAVGASHCGELIQGLKELQDRNADTEGTLRYSVDTALREQLLKYLSQLLIEDPGFVHVWYLVDIATVLGDTGYSEPSSNIQLLECLLDSQTVTGCKKVFDYLESRREQLIAHQFKEKSLVILRCCNELLRRLSRAEDTVLCGRVFIFLFQSFPLGDRSSVNLRGEFHVQNETIYDTATHRSEDAVEPMAIDGEMPASSGGQTPASTVQDSDPQITARSTPVPAKTKQDPKPTVAPPDLNELYPRFWSLQNLFSRPTRLFEPSAMTEFRDGISLTLSSFKAISSSSHTATHPQPTSRGIKRKRSDDGGRKSQGDNPKYLTNRDLFDLEVHDLAFRRHILAQCLIMLDFLLSQNASSKARLEAPIIKIDPEKGGKEEELKPNPSVKYNFELSAEDSKFCHSMRSSIATYLQQQGPGNDGKMYYRMVDTVLRRDKNWTRWKLENCPTITKAPLEVEEYRSTQTKLVELTERRPFLNPQGANNFDFLLHTEPLGDLKHPSKRKGHDIPTLEQYYNAIEGRKLDNMMDDEDEQKAIDKDVQGMLWRALRASALTGQRFVLCEKIQDGANTRALIGKDEEPSTTIAEGASEDANESTTKPTNGDGPEEAIATPIISTPTPQMQEPAGDESSAKEPSAVEEEQHTPNAEVQGNEDSELILPGTMDLDESQVIPEIVEPVAEERGEAKGDVADDREMPEEI
jgi:THO complex subunit 1